MNEYAHLFIGHLFVYDCNILQFVIIIYKQKLNLFKNFNINLYNIFSSGCGISNGNVSDNFQLEEFDL